MEKSASLHWASLLVQDTHHFSKCITEVLSTSALPYCIALYRQLLYHPPTTLPSPTRHTPTTLSLEVAGQRVRGGYREGGQRVLKEGYKRREQSCGIALFLLLDIDRLISESGIGSGSAHGYANHGDDKYGYPDSEANNCYDADVFKDPLKRTDCKNKLALVVTM